MNQSEKEVLEAKQVDALQKIFSAILSGLANVFDVKIIRVALTWFSGKESDNFWAMVDRGQKIMRGELCAACGSPGHLAQDCPTQKPKGNIILPFGRA